jgi:predicted dehydrogenase
MNYPTRRAVVGGGIAAALAPQLLSQRGWEPKNAKIGLIGLGNRAQAHLRAYREMGNVEITALSDIQADRMRAAREGPAANAAMYVDYRELLADKNVEAVVIVAPNYLHAKFAVEAIEAGKDVLMEKPIGLNYEEAKAVAAAAKKHGRILAVGIQRHYADDYRRMIEFVRASGLGKVHLYAMNEYRGDWSPRTWRWPDPESGETIPWRHLRRLAGSSLLEFSVHSYGFLYEMIQAPLTKCSASGGALRWPERTTEDAISVIAEFGDVRVQHTYCGFAAGAEWQLTIVGDKGSLQYDQRKAVVRVEGREARELDLSGEQDTSNEARMYSEFFDAVRSRKQPALNAEFAIEATKLAYAAWMSIDEDRFITNADFA